MAGTRVWNVPNSLSAARLLAALFVGLLIEWSYFLPAVVLFVLAVATDAVDGWWARRYGQITKLGRMLDPFVDKVIITAALVALVGQPGSRVAAWIVTIIISRELLVTSLRAAIEGKGGDFSARSLGKWKMIVQCALVVSSLLLLHFGPSRGLAWTTTGLAWAAMAITVASGLDYVVVALRPARALEATAADER